MIAQGKAKKEDVVEHSLDVFRSKFDYFRSHIGVSDDNRDSFVDHRFAFEAEFSLLTESGKPLSRCGICKHYMKYVKNPPPRLFCSECNVTYNLPSNGTIKLYKELKCPLDGFDLLLFSLGNSEKFVGTTYPCVHSVINNPPFES